MNNDAFRRLLTSSDGGSSGGGKNDSKGKGTKSTREIAREAVEEEFNERKRKRGRDEDYLSDASDASDEDGDGDRNSREDLKKEREKAEKEAIEEASEKEKKKKKLKYRNRARERRDGKSNIDYKTSNGIANELDEEMSKYLGGDEEHTHLVKGLDKTLADKTRREAMMEPTTHTQKEDLDLDKIMEEASMAKAKENRKLKGTPNSISEIVLKQATPLTTGMLSYLQKVDGQKSQEIKTFGYKNVGAVSEAGNALLRTTLRFSLQANIRDRFRSWEVPDESMVSALQYERMQSRSAASACTPLDRNLIEKIKSVFSGIVRANSQAATAKSSDLNRANSKDVSNKKGITNATKEATTSTNYSSDEDIFGDIGEYIPPQKKIEMK